jgi:amidohydrolase
MIPIPSEANWLREVTEFRRRLHAKPCLSGHEAETVAMISEFLKPWTPFQTTTLVNGTGLACCYRGNRPGKRLLLRADTDALPIQETNSFKHRSKTENVSHKCGHDGHTAILAGLAPFLSKGGFAGEVVLLFQPAEEVGKGAAAILADEAFESLKPDLVAGLHNLPGFPRGAVCLRDGVFAAASEGITINLTGLTAHAAYPETGHSPVLAVAQLLTGIEGLKNLTDSPDDFHLVTVIHARIGKPAFGTAPGDAQISATLRTYDNLAIDALKTRVKNLAFDVSQRHGLQCSVNFTEPFRATESHPDMVKKAALAATRANLEVIHLPSPFRWSEDFGQFTERWPGVFVGLGAGTNHAALHNPDYDFPDELLIHGMNFWKEFIGETLDQPTK